MMGRSEWRPIDLWRGVWEREKDGKHEMIVVPVRWCDHSNQACRYLKGEAMTDESVCPKCGLPTIKTNWMKMDGEPAQHMDCVQAKIILLRRKLEAIDDLTCDATSTQAVWAARDDDIEARLQMVVGYILHIREACRAPLGTD